jgi:DNA-directed RNA polymerase specialized sigma subunit
MTTLKDFEEALREQGLNMALAILEKLREQDRTKRSVAPPRRVRGKKMTPELARQILDLHQSSEMTQQEIAFQLGVNQGRVNEVIKRGKWLSSDPNAPEAVARDKAVAKAARGSRKNRAARPPVSAKSGRARPPDRAQAQLTFGEF